MLIVMSMIFPLLQLVVLGYAFGGNVKHLRLAIVDQDHGVPAVKIRELAGAVSSGARTLDLLDYADPGVRRWRTCGTACVNGVLTIPPDFSRRVLTEQQPRVALISDNTDTFVSATLAATVNSLRRRLQRTGHRAARHAGAPASTSSRCIPTCPTSSTCCRARSRCRSS